MLLQFYTIEDLSQPPSLQGQGLHFIIKSTQRHKWRGLILKEYFEKRGQARLDGWRFWWVLVHVWEGPWCTALPSRGHSGPYGDSECGIWTGCTSHHQSRCIIWIHQTNVPPQSSLFFSSSHFLLFCFGHCKPAITFLILFWPEVIEWKLFAFWQYATISHLSSLSPLSQLLCYLCCTGQASCSIELIKLLTLAMGVLLESAI